jgi:hypothetical protein
MGSSGEGILDGYREGKSIAGGSLWIQGDEGVSEMSRMGVGLEDMSFCEDDRVGDGEFLVV